MKQQLNEIKKFQKIAGLLKEDYDETNLDTIMHDIQSSLETSSALKTDFKLHALDIMSNIEAAMYEEDYDDVLTGFEELQDEIKSNNPIEYEQVYVEMLEKAIRRAEALAIENEDEGLFEKEIEDDEDDDDDPGSDNPEDGYGPRHMEEGNDYFKKRKDDDAAYHGLGKDKYKSDNPEGDQMVMDFLKMIAQEFDYPPEKGNPLVQAADFVKGRLKKLGYINEIDRNDPILMQTRANAYQKSLPKPKPTKIKTSMVIKNASKIKQLIADLKELEADLKELEREQDIEAGQLGDKWTDEKANEYGERMNDILDQIKALRDQIKALSGQEEQDSETNPYMDKAEIERRAATIMRLP
jgi:hypothetical protein